MYSPNPIKVFADESFERLEQIKEELENLIFQPSNKSIIYLIREDIKELEFLAQVFELKKTSESLRELRTKLISPEVIPTYLRIEEVHEYLQDIDDIEKDLTPIRKAA